MHGENETLEESLDLNYYMNNAAYEQLPEDIKKYVYRSGGTCDFDAMQWFRGIFERLMPICKDTVGESTMDDFMIATLVKIDNSGETEIDMREVYSAYDALKMLEDYAMKHVDDDEWVAETYAAFASGEDERGKKQRVKWLEKNGVISERFVKGKYDIELRLYESEEPEDYSGYLKYDESDGSVFHVGDKVEVKSKIHPSWFRFKRQVPVGTLGEVIEVDKPLHGIIKVKIEDGSVINVPERGLKIAGTDDEPWSNMDSSKETQKDTERHEKPEDYYMRSSGSYGSPIYTGD